MRPGEYHEPNDPVLGRLKHACTTSFASFCQAFQGNDWFDSIHADLCEFIQGHIEDSLFHNKLDCKILIVMGRGTLKTTFCTKLLPVWLTLPKKHEPWDGVSCPSLRTLIVTNTFTNAKAKLSDIRSMFDFEETFQAMFPEVLPRKARNINGKKDDWTSERLVINRPKHFPDATFTPASTGTRLTGTHFTGIIEDDTTAPDESDMKLDILTPSNEIIEKAIGWHKQATSLMVPKGFRLRLVVSTRWSEFDLVNHIKENEKGWAVFDIKTMQEDGSPAFPKLHNAERLKEIEEQVGPYMFQTLYQNSPLDQSQKMFQDQWIHYVPPQDVPEEGYYSVSIDPAISEKDEACETAITRVKHVMSNGIHPFQYWDRCIHKRMNPADQVRLTVDMIEEDIDNTRVLIVETVAYQKSLRFSLESEFIRRGIRMPIIKESRTGKDIRIQGLVPFFAAGRVILVKGLSSGVEKQLRQYPYGRLVDILDSFSMHYKALRREQALGKAPVKQYVHPHSWEKVVEEVEKKKAGKHGTLLDPSAIPGTFRGGFTSSMTLAELREYRDANPTTKVLTAL